jgi:hypothetical protein
MVYPGQEDNILLKVVITSRLLARTMLEVEGVGEVKKGHE